MHLGVDSRAHSGHTGQDISFLMMFQGDDGEILRPSEEIDGGADGGHHGGLGTRTLLSDL